MIEWLLRVLSFATLVLVFGAPPAAAASPASHVVFLIADDGSGPGEALPAFAREFLEPLGIHAIFVRPDPRDPNRLHSMPPDREVDVLVIAASHRPLGRDEAAFVQRHIAASKSVVGIRNASHDVFGARDLGELPVAAVGPLQAATRAVRHAILAGMDPEALSPAGPVARHQLDATSMPLIVRAIRKDGVPTIVEPVAWTRNLGKSRVFFTSLGQRDDFKQRAFGILLANAIQWALGRGAQGELGDDSRPTPPAEALTRFKVGQGFRMHLVAAEPTIAQPVFMTFDHRGRLWVVQYLQYPMPAGLKVVKYDQYLRAQFDKTPSPPPRHAPGKDVITVLEDVDGDGVFETKKDVITGLNIATAVAVGRGGLWVLNPPYLLFYPDRNGDDMPDADPEVHLAGFGLEDTHAVANSLRFGPDGWLYGSTGSTTTARITSSVTRDVAFQGQSVWRYHPRTHVFEVFAEGGGNPFSLEFDARGRIFTGTNVGEARGLHHVQGGLAAKNWGKHGPAINPYSLGWFGHMKHAGAPERFTQTLLVYEGGLFPASFTGALIAPNALYNRVHVSELLADGSTFRTKDVSVVVSTPDRWFRPVDVKAGPDGAVYIADWYDTRLTHVDPRDNWHKTSGRIYRLAPTGAGPAAPFDLARLPSKELVGRLASDNKWLRQEIIRILGDRRDTSLVPLLTKTMADSTGQLALEALWALDASGGFDPAAALLALGHLDPHVRRWGARLVGDARRAPKPVTARLVALARDETDPEVRSQLASTARRLPTDVALAMVRALATHDEDSRDPHIPLLVWWAMEANTSDRPAALALFAERPFWARPLVARHLIGRLMQRYALAGGPEDLAACDRLLRLAPDDAATDTLIAALAEAWKGGVPRHVPPELRRTLAAGLRGASSAHARTLALRLGDPDAVARALRAVADPQVPQGERMALVSVLGQIKQSTALPVLLDLARSAVAPLPLRRAALSALGAYDDSTVGSGVVAALATLPADETETRTIAFGVLASRIAWARALVVEIEEGRLRPSAVPGDVLRRLKLLGDGEIDQFVARYAGGGRSTTEGEKQALMDRTAKLLRAGGGHADAGRGVFQAVCAPCHTLFGEGGRIGPELTGYERTNLDFMLLAIADPSAGLREEYTNFVVGMRDGRTLSGFLETQDNRSVVLKSLDGQTTVLPREQVARIQGQQESVMPEGLLGALSDQQIRDLFAYLMMPAPLAHAGSRTR